jgi:hypothetical protein
MARSTSAPVPLLALVSLLTVSASLPAQVAAPIERTVGAMVYLDGHVGVTRDGEALRAAEVSIGMDVETYDTVATEADGTAEVEITGGPSLGAVLRIEPNTAFYFELLDNAKPTAELTILRGALALRVRKLSTRDVVVRTANTVLGVRGTTFRVVVSPTGDTLVTCREGVVEVRDDNAAEVAQPGAVVQKLGAERLSREAVALQDLDTYERSWFEGRIEALRANGLAATRQFMDLYERRSAAFSAAFTLLMDENGDLIRKWAEEDRQARSGGAMELLRDKRAIIGNLFRVKREMVLLDPVYHRLVELEGYHAQGIGAGSIRPGLTTQQFFAQFRVRGRQLARDLAFVRYVMKLYAGRNDGTFPGDL